MYSKNIFYSQSRDSRFSNTEISVIRIEAKASQDLSLSLSLALSAHNSIEYAKGKPYSFPPKA